MPHSTTTKNRLFGLLSLLLVNAINGWSQQMCSAPPELLTLEQATGMAVGGNHVVRDAQIQAGKTGEIVAAARTTRFPSLNVYSVMAEQFLKQDVNTPNVNFPNQVANIFPGVPPFFTLSVPRRPTAVFAGLVLQPLSQQYRLGLNIKETELARDSAREQLRLVKQSTVDSVKETYYAILQTQSALESIQEALTSYRELDRLTSDYVARRVSLKSASLDVKTRLAKAEYDEVKQSNELIKRKEQLNQLLGRDVRCDFRVNPAPDARGRGSQRIYSVGKCGIELSNSGRKYGRQGSR